jgi:hypothetical protein
VPTLTQVYADFNRGPNYATRAEIQNVADAEFILEDEILDDEILEDETGEEDGQEGSETDAEAQESDEYDIVLDGDEQASREGKQSKTVTLPAKKLADLRGSRRDARDEATKLREELERLRGQYGGKQQAQPAAMPTLQSCDYDEGEYQKKFATWHSEQTRSQLHSYTQQQADDQQRQARTNKQEQEIGKHYERASVLKVSDYESAERTVRETLDALSSDVSVTDLMIANLGEGSEMVTYYLGRNANELNDLVATLQDDPSGMRAMARLGKLQAKLTQKPAKKSISQAPAADEPLSGKTGASEAAIVKRLERLQGRTDMTEYRKLKSQLVSAGKSDLLRKHKFI